MPQFAPSVQKTAVAPITVAPAGLNCEAELFLGPNDATPVASSGIRTFLSTGSPQQVSFPVTMPASPGTYHVYIDVYAAGMFLIGYMGVEDVAIELPDITEYKLTVLDIPLQVSTGSNFNVKFQLDIPMSATLAHNFFTYIKASQRSASRGKSFGAGDVGRKVFDVTLTAKDWWYEAPLNRGIYELYIMMYLQDGPIVWNWMPTGVMIEVV